MAVAQTHFTNAIFQADLPVPEGLSDGQGAPAGKRFDVYRNNVAVSLTEALVTAFPTIHALVGDAFFRAMAGVFLRQHPPTSPLMMFYGAEMPAFLTEFEPVQHLPYLPDAARIDLGLRHAYHAADAASIAPDVLATVAPEELAHVTFKMAPSVHIIESRFALHDIWQASRGGPKPGTAGQDVLISRPDLDPEVDLLPMGAAATLRALATGHTLADANDAGLAACPAFDLGATLGVALQRGVFASLMTKD